MTVLKTAAAPAADAEIAPHVTDDASGVLPDAAPDVAPDAAPHADGRLDRAWNVPQIGTRRGWARVRTLLRPGVLVPLFVVLLVLAWGIAPALFTSYDPITGVPADKLQAPGAAHWFGTDHLGRDLFARTVHGTALSLKAAFIALGISLVAGAAIGLFAGFLGGWVDDALMRLVDVLLAIPGLLLSLAIVTALGSGTVKVAIAVGVAGVATFARVMRAQVLRVRHATFVEAAGLAGAGRLSIIGRHVLPNAASPVLVLAAVELGAVILAVSALSFLGYGAVPPTPEWGSLISEGRNYLAVAWWYSTLPGLVIIVFVVAVNRLGRSLNPAEGHH